MGEAPIKTIERNAATKQMRVSFTMSASLIFGEARSRVPNVHGRIKAAREMTPTELHYAMVTHTLGRRLEIRIFQISHQAD